MVASPFLTAALVAAVLWSGNALGQTADVCRDQWGLPAPEYAWPMWYLEMQRQNPEGVNGRTMTEAERVQFLTVFNSAPPITDDNPERIEMYWKYDSSIQVAVIFVENGCVTRTALMPRQMVMSIISPNTNGQERILDQPGFTI